MKKSHLMALMFIFSLHTLAQQGKIDLYGNEIITPTSEDKLTAAVNMGEVSTTMTKALNSSKKDCNDSKERMSLKPKNEVICFCELEAKKHPLIGALLFTEQDIATGNDNLFHGLPRLIPGFIKYDGTDYGRTFGLGTGVKFVGDKGEASVRFDSTGFGKGVNYNGSFYNPERKRNLEFTEQNTLALRLDKFWDIKADGKNRTFVEVDYVEETDKGKLAMPVQNWWHKMNGEKHAVPYNYLNHLQKDGHDVKVQIGVGKDLNLDLSKWKCLVRAEAKAGFSSKKGGVIASAKVSTVAKHRAISWLAVSLYAESLSGSEGHEKHRGLTLSFPFKANQVEIEPYLGIERHQTALDKKTEKSGANPYEPYHTLGIKIRY